MTTKSVIPVGTQRAVTRREPGALSFLQQAVELPGLVKKDVELNVSDNLLTIRGEKKSAVRAEHRRARG